MDNFIQIFVDPVSSGHYMVVLDHVFTPDMLCLMDLKLEKLIQTSAELYTKIMDRFAYTKPCDQIWKIFFSLIKAILMLLLELVKLKLILIPTKKNLAVYLYLKSHVTLCSSAVVLMILGGQSNN